MARVYCIPQVGRGPRFRYPDPMQVRILFFGILREQAGVAERPLDLPAGSTIADLLRVLRAEPSNPRMLALHHALAVAVNREYASASHTLHEGDEIAILPPVSGGSSVPGIHS